VEFPTFIYEVVAMVLLSTVAMFVLGLSLVRSLVKVLTIPRQRLMPIIFVLCVVGSFAIQARLFDVGVMVFFGLLGFFLREMDYPMAPLVLGIILGDILDKNLRRSLVLSNGDLTPFFTRPICLAIFLVTVFIIVSRTRWFTALTGKFRRSPRPAA